MSSVPGAKLQKMAASEFNKCTDASLPLDFNTALNLSSKKSAVLPTTTAAYLALEAAAARYAYKAASNALEASKKEWWDNIGRTEYISYPLSLCYPISFQKNFNLKYLLLQKLQHVLARKK